MSKDATARCERSDGWWAVEVPELPGIGQEMSEQAMATARKVVIE